MKTTIFKHLLATAMLLLVSTSLWSADGDTFMANTAGGVSMTFKVISESEKTCQVGDGNYRTPAIATSYAGVITIPSSANEYKVTSIGGSAFMDCSSLTSITIPSSVTSIRDWAFCGCSGLTSITIPSNVTSIGNNAFSGCSGLTSITIPSSVTSIGRHAFSGCSGLTSIKVENGNTKYDSRENCNAIIEKSSNTLIAGCQNAIIPSSVTSIGNYAFSGCSGLTSITIPNSVTSIGDGAFGDCSGLTSITIPEGVTSIGYAAFSGTAWLDTWYDNQPDGLVYAGKVAYKYKGTMPSNTSVILKEGTLGIGGGAFRGCSGLTSITIPSSVTSIGGCAFYGCSGLTSITIPEGVTSIEDFAFDGCSGLTSITIPSSVTSIGDRAFDGCSGLTSITIPSNVTSIEDLAFLNCSGLTSIKVENGNTKYDSRNNCNAIIETSSNTLIAGCQNTIIPSSVTSIGGYAFDGCSGQTSITIPSSVTSIGYRAFYGCSGLTSITIPSSVTSIGTSAFYNCSGLTSITIPSNVTSIADDAFYGCSSLTSIKVENGNTKYDSRENCNAIIETSSNTLIAGFRNTIIPSSVTSIGNEAFYGCSGLTSITIPSGVTSIGDGAFRGCSGLTSITIPSSLTSIGYGAFSGCSSLTSVTVCNETPVSIIGRSFSNRANATLYVPYGCKAAYEAARHWKEFKEIVEMPKVTSSLAISDASGLVGCTFNLPVGMKNEDEITAMQFELSLPEGVSVASAALTDRKDGHSIDYSQLANGNYQFTVFSSSSKAIKGTEGDVANISLSISSSMAAGSYTIQMKNIELTTTAGDAIHQSDLSATLTVLNLKPGDVNGDDKLSITDAVGIVNYILGKASANFHPEAADLNGDGGVSITDAVRVVNIILNQGSGVKERRTHKVENDREPQ